jgi:hypothetical protein
MKFIARVSGIWMIALAVILLVVDGTKSLAANALVLTSAGALWQGLHAESWASAEELVAVYLAPLSAEWLANAVLSAPAWALAGVLGLVALLLGRKRRHAVYAEPL